MYYVPDGTKECGYYECKKCGNRFLSLQTMNTIPCPDCGMDIDYEIGPMKLWKQRRIQLCWWRRLQEKRKLRRWIHF